MASQQRTIIIRPFTATVRRKPSREESRQFPISTAHTGTRNPEALPIISLRPENKPQEDLRTGLHPQFVRVPLPKPILRGKSVVAATGGVFHIEGKGLMRSQGLRVPGMIMGPAVRVAWGPSICASCGASPCACRKLQATKAQVPTKPVIRPSVPLVRVKTAPAVSISIEQAAESIGMSEEDESPENSDQDSPLASPSSPLPEERIVEAIEPCISPEGPCILLQIPLFRERPWVVLLDYPPQCVLPSKAGQNTIRMCVSEQLVKPLFYRYSESAHVYNCVVTALEYNGFKETSTSKFNLYISGSIRPRILLEMDEYQKYNHYPGSWQLGRKDNLWRNVSKMRRSYGEDFGFCPNTYLLPEDLDRFLRDREDHPKQLWIKKPVASACGRGIRVLSNKSRLMRKHGYLISAYISNPHLINGLKYDLRLYVCVTCYDPLRIYLYREGLVRFATQAYTVSKKSVQKRYIHLTNYSVNKKAANYQFNQQAQQDDQGSKWSHTALRRVYTELGIDPEMVFSRVKDVIIKTIMAAEPLLVNSVVQYTKNRGNCFETYGFDVLLDENLRPWLMEVNVSPSLNNGSPLDKRIKTALMTDIYSLIGFVPYDRKKTVESMEQRKQDRKLGLNKQKRKRPTILAVKSCGRLEDLDLPEEEIGMLMELEEEMSRVGNFERLFPTKETIESHSRYLQTDRVNNLLTWRLVEEDGAFLRRFKA